MSVDTGLTVATPTATEIVLTRKFAAGRELLFETLTRPDLLRRWYGARGWTLVECQIDLREGGTWRFVSRGPDGEEMGQRGEYRQIDPPARLVFTEVFDNQSYPGETLIAHQLSETEEVTTLRTVVRYASQAARDKVLRYPMARGLSEAYTRLDQVLRARTRTS
ncbi:SRPBCC domain-containing protein [Phytoactinopolyspora mesophila]|uniref:ATPase n=1 Tax=Phytoactinopolyspora mesophila TaxID=2650750 RepID=A0A7K3M4B4_9ACTN|nr:SRPBCC domain-containing protein [Phytoactinopolyspora mesophila]NDL58070.1 ATPase [Phytoactinopolyspora mesophila]